ncbi:hypothetical protein BJ912DRAFT_1020953 [Pholiota molesta]|nr:hypothetical protein BJ912DRAFT_1020953 [Pholiota molesta]
MSDCSESMPEHSMQSRPVETTGRSNAKKIPLWEHAKLSIPDGRISGVDGYSSSNGHLGPQMKNLNALPGSQTSSGFINGDIPIDAIKTEYHDKSGRKNLVRIDKFEDYRDQDIASKLSVPITDPWLPFQSRMDFEFAEVAFEACLNRRQIDKLIQIIHRAKSGEDKFNITTYQQLCDNWNQAASCLTPFNKETIPVSYRNIEETVEVYTRSLWDWAMDLISDPLIAPHFEWDARRLSKYDGEKFVRFVHGPSTANIMWKVQSQLPPNGKPLGFIVYVDKTLLSTFGTKKGYPVYARIANLPEYIRNGRGYAGGRLVGWLPILEDDPKNKGSTNYVNFKNVVWHKSFQKVLISIKDYSFTGCWTTDGLAQDLFLWPFVYAVSSDFEEQCIVALIRGLMGLCPCPICMIKRLAQSNFATLWPLRNMNDTRKIIQHARAFKKSKTGIDEYLKDYGLRDVDNAFWEIQFSDPHQILSFDHMHNYPHGLGGKHLWSELQKYISAQGSEAEHSVDAQASQFPRWRGLNHFNHIMGISFSDAMKLQDIVQISPFITQSILTREASPNGYLLLCCIRRYLHVDSYFLRDLHTEDTITEGKKELKEFSDMMEIYIEATSDTSSKGWDIPKMHLHSHAFDDIFEKGNMQVYDSLFNEPMHGPLKDSYLLRTNFKNVDGQILKADHWAYTSAYLQNLIDFVDENKHNDSEIESDIEGSKYTFNNITLGSRQKPITIQRLLEDHANDEAFNQFQQKLQKFLSIELQDILPDLLTIHLSTKITEFHFIKVAYESRINWKTSVDYLRCSPNFNHAARYDCVIVDTTSGVIFAKLALVFTIQISGNIYPLALVHPFTREYLKPKDSILLEKDKDLRFLRLRKLKDKKAEFIFARCIIRGVVLVPALDKEDNYLVFDMADTDITVRVREILEC